MIGYPEGKKGPYTIPNSVTSIGSSAFYNCRGLTSVTIPNSVTSIGSSAFSGCSGLTSVIIPHSVTSIGSSAFFYCIGLTSVTIPNSVTQIGDDAFSNCWTLTSVTIPNSVTSIGNAAFSYCKRLTKVTIPSSVTEIGERTFSICTRLTSVTIPNSVTSIGAYAFDGCSGLTSVTIPNSVTSIGSYAFHGCSGLTSVIFNAENCTYCGSSSYWAFPSNIKSLTIGKSVTAIPSYAFKGCSGLTSVTIPNSVTSIGDEAFCGCSGLTSVTIPSSVTEIGEWTFSGCSGLTSVTIGNSVNQIGYMAFKYCRNINHIICFAGTPPGLAQDTFESQVYENTSLIIPLQSKELYKSSIYWKEFKNILEIPEFDIKNAGTLINQIDIANVDKILILKISGEINGTDLLTLNKMTNLEWLDLSEATIVSGGMNYYEEDNTKYGTKDNTLGNYWAYALDKLETVYLPENLTAIGDNAFSGKSNIKSLTIPESVIAIGNNAFSGCSELTSMSIPASVMAIGNNAFANCSKLTELRFEDGDMELFVGNNMLAGSPIETLHLGRNVGYQNSPFRENRNLTKLTIGTDVTSIKWGAFYRCYGVESVEIPNSVTEIGNSAFGECSSLNSVILPLGLTDISVGMFSNCSKLASVTIPGGVRYIRSGAFKGCSALESVNMINPIPAVIDEDSFDFTATLNVPEESKVYYWLHPLWSKFPNLQAWNVGTDIDFVTEDGNSTTFHITSEESATVEVTAATLLSRAPGELTIPETVTYNGKVYTVAGIANNAFHDMAFEAIELPKTIAYVGLNAFSGCSELKTLRVNALLPPSAARESFDDNVFAATTLIVPDDAVDAYRDHDIWKLFNTIENAEIDEIDAPATEAPKQVYDMRGVRVGDSLEGLPHGVYIIRQGSKTTKHAI